jgi:hypothetical protein
LYWDSTYSRPAANNPWMNRQTDTGHFRQVSPFATKQVLHVSATFSLSISKKVYILLCHHTLLSTIWFNSAQSFLSTVNSATYIEYLITKDCARLI